MERVFEEMRKNATVCVAWNHANSEGLVRGLLENNILLPVEHKLPLMHVRLVLIFLVTQSLNMLLKRFGLTPLVSHILAGLILSPSALGSTKLFKNILSTQPVPDAFLVLLQLSFGFFLFIFGVKIDLSMIFRTGRKAWVLGIASFLVPVIIAFTYSSSTIIPPWKFYVSTLQASSSFAVISSLLHDLKLVNTELGRLGLSASFISDMGSMALTSIMLGAQRYTLATALKNSGMFFLLLLVLLFVARPGMMWIIRQTPAGKPVKDIYVQLIVGAMIASSIFSQTYAYQIYVGGYFFGLIVPDGPPLGSAVIKKTESFTLEILLPLLTSLCMMVTDSVGVLKDFKFTEVYKFCIILVLVVFLAKFMSSLLVLLCCKLPFNHAVALALILCYQGIYELNAVALSVYFGYLSKDVFAFLSIPMLLNIAIIPGLLRALYNPSVRHGGYQKRNIMDLKQNSELKILACIHRPDNIASIKTLFDVCQPTAECPVTAYVLHLVELVGRVSPIFITHQLQKKSISGKSYSAALVRSFCDYETNNQGAVSMNIFTAVSPANVMLEDINTLALDKVASLIVLPFHRKWSMSGLLESDSSKIRTLNCGVLETAPCSVGILVDHGHMGHLKGTSSSGFSYHIGMIFIGGKDDWEALSIAKRMAREDHICLTVIHLNVARTDPDVDRETKLDNAMMNDIKMDSFKLNNVRYREENVSDGVDIASRLLPLVDECDIFIVGRQHSSETSLTGLPEWCEFPELGIIGDLLASSEFNSNASVLILQQQDLKS